MNNMYNESRKNDFLNTFTDKTAKAYRTVFYKTKELEEVSGKDLSSFSLDEISYVMLNIKPSTKTASRTAGRVITKYISWANNDEFKVPQKFFDQFVPKQSSQYLRKETIDDMLKELVNDSDALIVKLLFEGVEGKQASEIRNLKISDVKQNNDYIIVCDDKHYIGDIESYDPNSYSKEAYRKVYIEKDTIRMIRKSHNEPDYWKKNGEAEGRAGGRMELPSPHETPYVIKTSKTQGKHYMSRASQYTIYNRIEMIRSLDWGNINPEAFITKNIKRSGMIYQAYKLLSEGKELNNEQIKMICDKYNVKNQWSVKDFLNKKVVEDIYGEIKKKEEVKV